uniref:Alternative protein MAVS n=1 Tax=Homo sapiens TaxID=9606 RepID=L8E900_HUMAN|nr:alternative protein MAVS [Homo sapiens]
MNENIAMHSNMDKFHRHEVKQKRSESSSSRENSLYDSLPTKSTEISKTDPWC